MVLVEQAVAHLELVDHYLESVAAGPPSAHSLDEQLAVLRQEIAAKDQLLSKHAAKLTEWHLLFDRLAQLEEPTEVCQS